MLRAYHGLFLLPLLVWSLGSSAAADAPSLPLPGSQLPAGAVARLGAMRLTHRQKAYDAAFSPDGQTLAVATGKNAKLWDEHKTPQNVNAADVEGVRLIELATGQQLLRVKTGPIAHGTLAFSPDGRLFATADRTTFHLWDVATGLELYRRDLPERGLGERPYSYASALAILPGGERLATGHIDGTILIWDLEPKIWQTPRRLKSLDSPQLERCWTDLAAEDAARAHLAAWNLAANPSQAVPFFKKHLHATATLDAKQLERWLADLDSGEFTVREAASKKLASVGEQAEPALQQALAGKPSREARRRVQALLEDAQAARRGVVRSPEALRTLRAIRVLESIGDQEARKVLEMLAGGDAVARTTQQAKDALRRLAVRN